MNTNITIIDKIKIVVYGQTAHNRTVYAPPPFGGSGVQVG
jgi:hypothetical protein